MYYILITLVLLFATGFLYLYWFFKKSHQLFDQYGIPYVKPHWLFGHFKDVFLMGKPIWLAYKDMYDKHESDRFAGVYTLHRPAVMIRDPELIKTILVKEFSNFRNRSFPAPKESEPITENLFNMKGKFI